MDDVINLPDILPYPEIQDLSELDVLKDQFVYLIKEFPQSGLSVVIHREAGHLCIRFGDFEGNVLGPDDELVKKVNEKYGDIGSILSILIHMTKLTGVKQAQYYLSSDDELRLVDMRVSLNKFTGPGYIRDFFPRIPTQEIIKAGVILDQEVIDKILEDDIKYIIKPSKFKFIMRDKAPVPMYGKISNEA